MPRIEEEVDESRLAVNYPMMIYLGVDPGKSGGLAYIDTHGYSAMKMPLTERDIWEFLIGLNPDRNTIHAVIEKVGGYISGRGKKGSDGEGDSANQPGSSMFKFGTNYGALRMALTAAGISWEEIAPATWQKSMHVQRPKETVVETDTERKNRFKARAQQLFPKVKVTKAVADAMLLAEYCRRKQRGTA